MTTTSTMTSLVSVTTPSLVNTTTQATIATNTTGDATTSTTSSGDPSPSPAATQALRQFHISSSANSSTPTLSSQSYDTSDMEMDLDMEDYDEEDEDEDDDDGYNGVRLDQSHNDTEPNDAQTNWSRNSVTNGASQAHYTPQQGSSYSTFTIPKTIPDRSLVLSPAQTKPKLADFELLKTLGTGTFARVWLTRPIKSLRTSPAQLYALKQLRKTDVIKLKQVEHVLNERSILTMCKSHPFIINLLSSWSDRDCLYMLLDYSPGGELFGYLRRNRRFDFETTRIYSGEITLIMEFLHDNGIVYRDLKPENILLDARGHVKLVDFGFAKRIGELETYTLCGTPEYLSPEVIQSQGHGTAVDWWAMVGFPPFYASSPFEIYERIIAGRIAFPPWMTTATRDIISRLCTADRTSRLGNLKGGARDVKAHPFYEGTDWEELASHRKDGPIVPKLAFTGDTRYFDHYDPPSPTVERYTESMMEEYEEYFQDF